VKKKGGKKEKKEKKDGGNREILSEIMVKLKSLKEFPEH
jgi:hypothetical protein